MVSIAVVEDKPSWAKDLDDREYAWLIEYLIDFNAKRAALAVGAKTRSAHNRGSDYKRRPHIRAALAAAMRERMAPIKMTMMERLAAIVTTDIGEIVQWQDRRTKIGSGKQTRYIQTFDMNVRPTKDLSLTARAAIKSVKRRAGLRGDSLEVVMHDPIAAAEKLAAILGITDAQVGPAGGNVTFVIEAPDGTVVTQVRDGGPVIDHEEIQKGMAKNRPVGPEELPPGAKLEIETP